MLLASTNSIVRKETTAMAIYHDHHIIPKHMGGTDDPENIVRVSVEKHAELHYQLWEDLGDYRDWLAWNGLKGLMSHDEILANIYRENAKRVHEYNKNNGIYEKRKGVNPHSDEEKLKISKRFKGIPKSEEHKAKLRTPKSNEHKQKLKYPKSEEHKRKLSLANKNKRMFHNDKLKINKWAKENELNSDWILGKRKYD